MEDKIVRILLKNYTKISRNGGIAKVIFDDRFEDIAEEIVKLFAIPVVVVPKGTLVCDHFWMNSGVSLQGKRLKMCQKCGITN